MLRDTQNYSRRFNCFADELAAYPTVAGDAPGNCVLDPRLLEDALDGRELGIATSGRQGGTVPVLGQATVQGSNEIGKCGLRAKQVAEME